MKVNPSRVRHARRAILNAHQREIAALLHIEPVNVSRWERGTYQPSRDHLAALARLSRKPVSWFYEKEDA